MYTVGQKVVCNADVEWEHNVVGPKKDEVVTITQIVTKYGIPFLALQGYDQEDGFCYRRFSPIAPIQTERIRYVAVCEELKNVPQTLETIDN